MRVNNASDGINTFVFAVYKMAAQSTRSLLNTLDLRLRNWSWREQKTRAFLRITRPELQHHFLFPYLLVTLATLHVLPYLRF